MAADFLHALQQRQLDAHTRSIDWDGLLGRIDAMEACGALVKFFCAAATPVVAGGLEIADDLHRVSTGYLTDWALETSIYDSRNDVVRTVRFEARGAGHFWFEATGTRRMRLFAAAQLSEQVEERFERWEASL